MMIRKTVQKAFLAMVVAILMPGCQELNTIDLNASDSTALQNESNFDAQVEEVDDLATVAVSSDASTLTGGRIITSSDPRLQCATITLEPAADNTLLKPHGFITIDFGAACAGPGNKVRSGKIIIEYQGRRFLPGSRIVTTFQAYAINGRKLDGTRTLVNVSTSETAPVSFSILEDGMKVSWPDGTTATRTSTRTRTWNRVTNPSGDTWTVTGSATGTTRKGVSYAMEITTALVFKRTCATSSNVFMPVQGVKQLIAGGKKLVIDYGDGACDNVITVTLNGKSKTVDVLSE